MFVLSCTSDYIWNKIDLIRYLVQNQHGSIAIHVNPEAICLHNLGLYEILDCFDFEKVEILTSNPFEQHNRYTVKFKPIDQWFRCANPVDGSFHFWNRQKVFLCLFGRPTVGRLGIAAHLNNKYQEITHLHFSTGTSCDELEQYELDKLLSYDCSLIEPVGKLINKMPILLGDRSGYSAFNGFNYSDPLANLYKDILIDVVVESHAAGRTFFPTEKIARSILMKKPFVVHASCNFLEYLRQMGFMTFHNFWSEDYDGYETKERLTRLIKLIDYLSSRSLPDLVDIYKDMEKILDHNYSLLTNKEYNTILTLID